MRMHKKSELGANMIEYVILLGIFVVVTGASVQSAGEFVSLKFDFLGSSIENVLAP